MHDSLEIYLQSPPPSSLVTTSIFFSQHYPSLLILVHSHPTSFLCLTFSPLARSDTGWWFIQASHLPGSADHRVFTVCFTKCVMMLCPQFRDAPRCQIFHGTGTDNFLFWRSSAICVLYTGKVSSRLMLSSDML